MTPDEWIEKVRKRVDKKRHPVLNVTIQPVSKPTKPVALMKVSWTFDDGVAFDNFAVIDPITEGRKDYIKSFAKQTRKAYYRMTGRYRG